MCAQLTAGDYVQIRQDAEHHIDAILTTADECRIWSCAPFSPSCRPGKCEFDGIALLLLTTPLSAETQTQTVGSRHRSSWPQRPSSPGLSLSDPHRRSRPRLCHYRASLTCSNLHRVLFPCAPEHSRGHSNRPLPVLAYEPPSMFPTAQPREDHSRAISVPLRQVHH